MFDSLPYRNDAAIMFRRLARSLPLRAGVLGIATCDKGLPAMMMAVAGLRDLPCVVVPGGVTLPATGGEDAGTVQTLGARFAHGLVSLAEAADLGCRACAIARRRLPIPRHGGDGASGGRSAGAFAAAFRARAFGPAGVAGPGPAFGPRAASIGRAQADHARYLDVREHSKMRWCVHAAFGGSTNLLLHIPAIAHAAGLEIVRRSRTGLRSIAGCRAWSACCRTAPSHHPTVRVFLAGGVPEVMLHLRQLGLLQLNVLTVTGKTLGENLDWWEGSERRRRFRELLREKDGVEADEVIFRRSGRKPAGLTSTLVFPRGNLAPEGSVVKSTAIDPAVVDADGVYRKEGPARVFVSEKDAMAAIKQGRIQAGRCAGA